MEGDCTISIPISEVWDALEKKGWRIIYADDEAQEVRVMKPDFCTCANIKTDRERKENRCLFCRKPLKPQPIEKGNTVCAECHKIVDVVMRKGMKMVCVECRKPQPKEDKVQSLTIYVQADVGGRLKTPMRIEDETITDLGIYDIGGIKYWVVAEAEKPQPKAKLPEERTELFGILCHCFPRVAGKWLSQGEFEEYTDALIRYLKERE